MQSPRVLARLEETRATKQALGSEARQDMGAWHTQGKEAETEEPPTLEDLEEIIVLI